MEPTDGSETSTIRTKTPGNYPKENILHNVTVLFFQPCYKVLLALAEDVCVCVCVCVYILCHKIQELQKLSKSKIGRA